MRFLSWRASALVAQPLPFAVAVALSGIAVATPGCKKHAADTSANAAGNHANPSAQADANASAVATPAVASLELPAEVLGEYQGNLLLTEGGMPTRSHTQVTCTVAKVAGRYRIRFSGGVPMVDLRTPNFDELIFAAAPGSEPGVFYSISAEGSVEGVMVSTTPSTVNIDTPTPRGQLTFTGRR